MLTVMVCCFLVFGVQKGDDNVLNSSTRRSRKSRRSSSFAATNTGDEYYEEERHRRHHHHHHHGHGHSHHHHHHHHRNDRIEEDEDSELSRLQNQQPTGKLNHTNLVKYRCCCSCKTVLMHIRLIIFLEFHYHSSERKRIDSQRPHRIIKVLFNSN